MSFGIGATAITKAMAVDSGMTTAPVSVGGNTLTDATKNWATNVHKNRLVKIIGSGQLKVIDSNSANALVIEGTWPQAIPEGSTYVILDKDLIQLLRDGISPRFPLITTMPQGVIWKHGTGQRGLGEYELAAPHHAEELDGDKVLIVEYRGGSAAIIIDKASHLIIWQFGDREVSGSDATHLYRPTRAHRLPDGSIIIADYGNHRVLIVDYDTQVITWELTGLTGPYDAIYWDAESIMVSEGDEVIQVRLSDKATLWTYDGWTTYFTSHSLQKLSTTEAPLLSYGGDLLIGFGGSGGIREIKTSDKSTVWEYGFTETYDYTAGEAYQDMGDSMYARRFGGGEFADDYRNASLTLATCSYLSKVVAISQTKRIAFEIGGNFGLRRYTPYLNFLLIFHPASVNVTAGGNLLICDWGANVIYEVIPALLPPREFLETTPARSQATTDAWVDCRIIEVHNYSLKHFTIFNTGANSLDWKLLGSNDLTNWHEVQGSKAVAAGASDELIAQSLWHFIKPQIKSTGTGLSGTALIHLVARR